MPLLRAEAEKLDQADLTAGVIEEIIDKEDLFAVLPFTYTEGTSLDYNRENTLSEAQFIDPVTGTVPEGAATFTEATAKLRTLIGDVDVPKFLNRTMSSSGNSQLAVQLAQKAKGLARKFRRTLVTGDAAGSPEEFDGIQNIVGAAQTIAGGEASLTFSMLDELLDAVPNGADAILMNPIHIRAYRALVRAAGGIGSAEIMMEDFGRSMLTHNGVPILENEFIPDDAAVGGPGTYSIYAARINEADGLHGIYNGENAGVVVENIGTVQNKDHWRWRLKWYVSLVLRSTQSLARIEEVG